MNNIKKRVNFIIIDDSELDCFIAEKLIEQSGIQNTVKSFLQADVALDYIKSLSDNTEAYHTIILLDILMPIMSGIDFVEEFEKMPEDVQTKYTIIAFTSSMNKKDMNRMQSFKSVKYLYDKPIGPEFLKPLLNEMNVI